MASDTFKLTSTQPPIGMEKNKLCVLRLFIRAREPMRVNQKKIRGRGGRKKEEARLLKRTAEAVVSHEERLKQEIIKNINHISALQQRFEEIYVAQDDPILLTSLSRFIRKEIALVNSNIYAYNHNEEKYFEFLKMYEKLRKEELDVKTNKFAFFGPKFEIIYKTEKEFAEWYLKHMEAVNHNLHEVPKQYEKLKWWSYPPPDNLYSPISHKISVKRPVQPVKDSARL